MRRILAVYGLKVFLVNDLESIFLSKRNRNVTGGLYSRDSCDTKTAIFVDTAVCLWYTRII